MLLTVVVPELAPIFSAVAAPAKLTVVAVVLTNGNVVWLVVIPPVPLAAIVPVVVTLPNVPKLVKLEYNTLLANVAPVRLLASAGPVGPVTLGPVHPVGPVTVLAGPVHPVGPVTPVGPVGPCPAIPATLVSNQRTVVFDGAVLCTAIPAGPVTVGALTTHLVPFHVQVVEDAV
jgi:hypothetical protein